MEKYYNGCNFMCARRSGNILFYFIFYLFIYLFIFLADNFTGSKDTEPYKTDVSFLCQYIVVMDLAVLMVVYLCRASFLRSLFLSMFLG